MPTTAVSPMSRLMKTWTSVRPEMITPTTSQRDPNSTMTMAIKDARMYLETDVHCLLFFYLSL